MSVFEYASGLVSIVVGLAVGRVLGGVATFIRAGERSPSDWITASWCVGLLLTMMGWWIAGWALFRETGQIAFGTLATWFISTSFLYLAASLLIPGRLLEGPRERGAVAEPPGRGFYYCLGAHYGVALLMNLVADGDARAILIISIGAWSAAGAFVRTDRIRALHLAGWFVLLALLLAVRVPGIR